MGVAGRNNGIGVPPGERSDLEHILFCAGAGFDVIALEKYRADSLYTQQGFSPHG